ncbi:MAG TPA: phosphoribosyltransferase family protein, partial [Limnochordia bacterium]
GIPALFVRKEPKAYGTRQLAEGGEFAGQRLLVIEDVITSGGQVIESARRLEEAGGRVIGVLCVIDREAGGKERIAQAGWPLWSLFTKSELESAARGR